MRTALSARSTNANPIAHFSKEPSDHVTKHNGLVGFVVVGRRRDSSQVPQV